MLTTSPNIQIYNYKWCLENLLTQSHKDTNTLQIYFQVVLHATGQFTYIQKTENHKPFYFKIQIAMENSRDEN